MRSSTTFRKTDVQSPGAAVRPWAIVLWLLLWQIAAMAVGRDFLLASPLTVLLCFWQLVRSGAFWSAALHSAGRILLGFLLGALDKFSLFPAVRRDGVLPRKTFSMGEACEKRYYMECRRIL